MELFDINEYDLRGRLNQFLYGTKKESNFEDSKPAMRPIYYHGHIKIYTLVPLDQDDVTSKRKFWLEYDLKFTDSRVVSAIMISPTREDLKGTLGSEGSSI
jgi:hypothetical protein